MLSGFYFTRLAATLLMKSTDLLQLVDNLHQAGKIHNLQQVCIVSGCVQY